MVGAITTALSGGRRDRNRLQWEQDRQSREWQIRRDERFLDLKRELYSDYMLQAGQLMSYIDWEDDFPDTPRPDEPPDTEKLRRVQENIGLVAPRSLFTKIQTASAAVTGAMWAVAAGAEQEDVRKETAYARRALDAIRRDMRADLRGEEDRFFEPARRARLEQIAPDPPPAHALPWWRRALRRAIRRPAQAPSIAR